MYPVWICRDPISLILGTRFSILGTGIGSLKHLKNPGWSKDRFIPETKRAGRSMFQFTSFLRISLYQNIWKSQFVIKKRSCCQIII